jgi:hypothetical protein
MDISSSIAGSTADYKHFPIRNSKPRRRTVNHFVRAAAKRLAQENNNAHLYQLRSSLLAQAGGDGSNPRQQLESALRKELFPVELKVSQSRSWRSPRGRLDQDDGEALAKSNVPLPSDHARLVRRPTLEREDAFRDASTSKGNVRLRRAVPAIYGDEDAQVADLYRMGLLYDDDERDRAEALNLNSIRHDEALYTIRPAKRARRNKSRRNEPLHLNLSFADLGNDHSLAQYLSSPVSELPADASERCDQDDVPIRVIYEIATSTPSYDVDTSQPPDLVDDNLSDYDYLSETELDDTPSQQEVYDTAANPPTDAWIMLGDDS